MLQKNNSMNLMKDMNYWTNIIKELLQKNLLEYIYKYMNSSLKQKQWLSKGIQRGVTLTKYLKKKSSKTKLVQKIYCFDLQQGGDNKKTEIGGATFAESFRILPLIFW